MNERSRVLMPILSMVIMVGISFLLSQTLPAHDSNDPLWGFLVILAIITTGLFYMSLFIFKDLLYSDKLNMLVIAITSFVALTGVFIAVAYSNGQLPSNGTPTLVPDDIVVTVIRNDNQIVQRIISTEEVRVNNCDGSRAVTNEVSRIGTVANTVEIDQSYVNHQGEFYIEGLGAVQIGQEIASEYGLTYGQVEPRERSIVLETEEQTNVAHTIQNIESWQSGEIVIQWKDQEVGRYPYLFRTDFNLNLVDSTDLGCSE